MAPADKTANAPTPGRIRKKTNQYFEIGKLGRYAKPSPSPPPLTPPEKPASRSKTRACATNTASNPSRTSSHRPSPRPRRAVPTPYKASPPPRAAPPALTPEPTAPPPSRKTPRLPPARASTPRHTNLGSPKRSSTGRRGSPRRAPPSADDSPAPRPNRVLFFAADADAADAVHTSIESASPFKPRNALRRSLADNPFASPARVVPAAQMVVAPTEAPHEPTLEPHDAYPPHAYAPPDESYAPAPAADTSYSYTHAYDAPPPPDLSWHAPPSSQRARRLRSSRSDLPESPAPQADSGSSKRSLRRMQDETAETADAADAVASAASLAPEPKRRRSARYDVADRSDVLVDPALLAFGDQYVDVADDAVDDDDAAAPVADDTAAADDAPPPPAAKKRTRKHPAPTRVRVHDSPSKLRAGSASRASPGRASNVLLRATTPFEDAQARTSRYGRHLIAPLKYWANETKVYRHGECERIIRADEVVPARRGKKKKRGKRGRKGKEDEDEESVSETESLRPDDWEAALGVITGPVAPWDPARQTSDAGALVHEGAFPPPPPPGSFPPPH